MCAHGRQEGGNVTEYVRHRSCTRRGSRASDLGPSRAINLTTGGWEGVGQALRHFGVRTSFLAFQCPFILALFDVACVAQVSHRQAQA